MPDFKDIKAKLAEAERVAQELDQVANLDESLIKQTKQNLSKAKESAVLQKLAELPVENLRDATDTSLRIETLRRLGSPLLLLFTTPPQNNSKNLVASHQKVR